MHFDPVPFDWILGLSQWIKVLLGGSVLVIFIALCGSLAVAGLNGPAAVFRQLVDGIRDVADLSARRIWALAMLTVREAVRRKALLVFVVFAILFMFGSWFL